MSDAENPLPRPRRHITGTLPDGNSFFPSSPALEVPITTSLGSGSTMSLAYSTSSAPPISMTNDADLDSYRAAIDSPPKLWTTDGSTNMWIIDNPPGGSSPMHRTTSIDYIIQIVGEVELHMSNGEVRLVKQGDVVVQRSTLHKWHNPSKTQWSRFVAVLTGSKRIVSEGKGELGPEGLPEHVLPEGA